MWWREISFTISDAELSHLRSGLPVPKHGDVKERSILDRCGEIMQNPIKKTLLHAWHTSFAATMGDFSGWSMPMWYQSGAVAEHRAVITHAGLFDTSDMDILLIRGPLSFALLQLCFTRDLRQCVGPKRRPLVSGQCVYGAFLNDQGHVVDDAIVSQVHEDEYVVAVNAGMAAVVVEHLSRHVDGSDTQVSVWAADVGKMDLQGPMSAKILRKVLQEPDRVLNHMGYFTFRGHFDRDSPFADTRLVDGTHVLISRTGYTGEFGFEICAESSRLVGVWETILSAGREFGLIPCGLAARDSLRAGAVLPLSHQDIGPWPFINHPWSVALPFDESGAAFTKQFVGDRVLAMREHAEHTHAFVGFDPRKALPQDHPVVRDTNGQEIGVVLTCVADMAIDRHGDRIVSIASPDKPEDFRPRGLSCGFVRVTMKQRPGEIVELKDNRRAIKVMIVDDIRPDRTARRPMREMV
jgi:aminomethyltransferase